MDTRFSSRVLLALITAAMLCGCGYRQSGQEVATPDGYKWRSLYRRNIRTVAVPIFTNRDFTQGVEFRLTKALVNQIEAVTPYKVVDRDKADSIIEGQITAISGTTVSQDIDTAVPQERLLTITVDFLWKDLRTGRILVQRKSFQQSNTYYPTLGEGSPVGEEQAVERLAAAIVHEMEAEW